MASTNPLVEFSHYSCTLLSTHTHQDWVSEPMPEHLPIQKGVLGRISFYFLALLGLQWEYPINQVASVWCHPCKLFMSTLTGMAIDWFISLPNGHITSFQQLSQLFGEQHLANRAPPPVSYDLFDVKQYQGETLKEYINRFGAQVVKVGTSEEPMIMYAFRKGVCPGPFCESIIRNRPRTFAEIRCRAVEHIASKGEVCEKRTSVVPSRPRAQMRAQPVRVNEATTGRKKPEG